jgi:glycosyltransferase involved in cell wall biosynthesis
MPSPHFALYYAEDGYSTAKKIMGRQSAGKSLLRGIARKWPTGEVLGFGPQASSAPAMLAQLRHEGFAGTLRWSHGSGAAELHALGSLYVPMPPIQAQALARNRQGPRSYSLFGVTHTLSSGGAMDLISDLILPVFQPWDGLICTSDAALRVVTALHDQAREHGSRTMGASRFNAPSLAVIPLGVNVPDFRRDESARASARARFGLKPDDVVFLFAGRLAFHAKANPTAFYQALEAACQHTGRELVCLEAGIYPNPAAAVAYEQARRLLAPSARFIGVDGADSAAYQASWSAADVFVSLSDNIQETFGITPLEAMAAGLPVVVSDWDGYKDTVRDGVDGFRIPTLMAAAGAGEDLAQRYAEESDSYDYYIGRVSMATAIDLSVLTDRLILLANQPDLRRALGEAGFERVKTRYDWPVILDQYEQFAAELTEKRRHAADPAGVEQWTRRPDPFALFAHYPSNQLERQWSLKIHPDRAGQVEQYLELKVANFACDAATLPPEVITALLGHMTSARTVGDLLEQLPRVPMAVRMRALMWLVKLGIAEVKPPSAA